MDKFETINNWEISHILKLADEDSLYNFYKDNLGFLASGKIGSITPSSFYGEMDKDLFIVKKDEDKTYIDFFLKIPKNAFPKENYYNPEEAIKTEIIHRIGGNFAGEKIYELTFLEIDDKGDYWLVEVIKERGLKEE